ncbi:MAG TPA: hypothetical protein PKC17_06365, partial [Geobacter anodireducens]|nr:hypothetical protein [Geobacter anodireducens]
GWLFKTKSTRREKTNLMIVLTPRIIRGSEDLTDVSNQQRDRFGEALSLDAPFDLKRDLQLSK